MSIISATLSPYIAKKVFEPLMFFVFDYNMSHFKFYNNDNKFVIDKKRRDGTMINPLNIR